MNHRESALHNSYCCTEKEELSRSRIHAAVQTVDCAAEEAEQSRSDEAGFEVLLSGWNDTSHTDTHCSYKYAGGRKLIINYNRRPKNKALNIQLLNAQVCVILPQVSQVVFNPSCSRKLDLQLVVLQALAEAAGLSDRALGGWIWLIWRNTETQWCGQSSTER